MNRLAALVAIAALAGCASVPRPEVLGDVDAVRAGPAAAEAKALAPGAYAHAEKLRRDAEQAMQAEDTAGAQILGEQALAAFAHASALARVARAETAATGAEAELAASQAELARIDADQTRVGAEVDALELRIRVARDAQPVVPSGPADPAREKARAAAAKAMALQARLLCGAARLLTAEPPAAPAPGPAGPAPAGSAPAASTAEPWRADLDAALAAVQKLDAALASSGPAPIDQATRAREGCLGALTKVRRAATPVSRAPGAGDALLSALSAAGLSPSRDDRGVFVTLRGLFEKGALSKAGEQRLAELGRVAAANPTFPVAVVVHLDRDAPKEEAVWRSRAEAVAQALKAARAPTVEHVLAGAAAPVVDPAGKDHARNARVEIVFITPESF